MLPEISIYIFTEGEDLLAAAQSFLIVKYGIQFTKIRWI